MKLSLLNLLFILFPFTLLKAQEIKSNDYYYNNFDGGQLGNALTQIGVNSSLEASNNAPISGAYSLSSKGNNQTGSYKIAAIAPNTSLDAETYGWEWTFLYRSTEDNTSSSNTWKYWLVRETDQANSRGCYLIQENKKLKLVFYQDQNNTWSNDIADLKKNKTYAIRVQRKSQKGWVVYLDEADSAPNGAYTKKASISWYPTGGATYHSSLLELSSTTAGRFTFDELKMYSMQLQITGANNSSNGISNPLYAGQQAAAIYGLEMQTRGFFDMYQFVLALTGNITAIIDNRSVKLYKSIDSYFVKKEEDKVASFSSNNVFDGGIQYWGDANNPFTSFYSVGNTDGSVAVAGYYFLTADVLANSSTTATFAIAGTPTITGAGTGINYAEVTGTVSNNTTESSSSGKIFDWRGTTSSAWNNPNNWKPNNEGVPTGKDFVRIGEIENFTNQPTVSSSTSVGNIIFGTKKTAILTVDPAAVLTVNGNVDTKEGITVTGQGAIDVKGAYTSALTAAEIVTGSIATFTVNDLVLYGKTKTLTYEAVSGNTVIKNAFFTKGSKAVTFTLLNAATLTLTGANPFSLDAAANTITLNNGTVVYGASVAQKVTSTYPYKNISFSGAGTKTIASGTLNISGNWNSENGKVDLLRNATSLNFNGADQTITDEGSDNGKGILFANVTFSGNTKTLSSTGKFAVAANKYLTLAANTTLQTADNITLKADASGAASVTTIPASSSIRGKAIVEVFLRGGNKNLYRTNRMLSSPVYDNSNNFINTDNGSRAYNFAQFVDDMIVTGAGGSANGFDDNAGSAASAWVYNNGFKAIPTINTSLKVGEGAYLYYRGDRTNFSNKVNAPFVDPESISMTFKGVLNQQNVTVALAKTTLIGNPYPSTIDWKTVTKSANVGTVIKVWNPSNRQYAVFNGTYGVNEGSRYIAAGQSFFIQTTNNSPGSITFKETDKIGGPSQSAPDFVKLLSIKESNLAFNLMNVERNDTSLEDNMEIVPPTIRVVLAKENQENTDETLVVLKQGELATVAGDDVIRGGGEEVFMSSVSAEGRAMAINYMPAIEELGNIKLGVDAASSGKYSMLIKLADIPLGFQVKLWDKYLNEFKDVSSNELNYDFSIDKTTADSFGNSRFELLVAAPSTLPVALIEFKGNRVNDGIKLTWKTAAETNNKVFEIYSAAEDKIYQKLATIPASETLTYHWVDKAPLVGNNYYKLVQIDKDGKISNFKPIVVKYNLNTVNQNLVVYPTIVEQSFSLSYQGNILPGNYTLRLLDLMGKTVLSKKLNENEIKAGLKLDISHLTSNLYFVELINSNGKSLDKIKIIKK